MSNPARCTQLSRRTVIALLGFAPLASRAQALSAWTLQVPGPLTVQDPDNYASRYFRRLGGGKLWFAVDCAEHGSTRNSEFVRSELRHRANWAASAGTRRMLAARISVNSHANPNRVTVMQIHGIAPDGSNAPPLLRVAAENGDLIAHIKSDADGNATERIRIAEGIKGAPFDCAIDVDGSMLAVAINNGQTVQRNLSFWRWANYFKIGCYPQAHDGVVEVTAESVRAVV